MKEEKKQPAPKNISAAPAKNPPPAEPGLIPSDPAGATPKIQDLEDFAWQDVMDRYETDESRYALDQEASSAGMILRFLGVEKRSGFYVLKACVENQTGSDFFIKDFQARSGKETLESRALFRVLVEAGNSRTGYLLFRPPLNGKDVQIVLEEDGGEGRRLSLPLALPF
ncbi:MAG: hypothetical protein KGI84_09415 [Elusimicrobia bacterium]|nr:hypothetical protein [Elusimicrobiota bacterium]